MKGQDDQVVIATHGRGIWTATIGATQESLRPVVTASGTSPKKQLMTRVDLDEDYTKLEFYVDGQLAGVTSAATTGVWTAALPGIGPGKRELKVVGYRGDAPVYSKAYSLDQLDIKTVAGSHVDYFANTEGIAANGFLHGLYDDSAPSERKTMHTLHPYVINSEAAITILHPVVVSATLPKLIYEDVVLVEPGVAGAAFGTTDFRDYVVMEASKNGLDWVALQDGYDARLHAEWLTSYEANTPGSRSLLRKHEINLLDRFVVGDTLLFRYRLHSDATVTGWGAALDYVAIQEEPTGLDKTQRFKLNVFPNPAGSVFNVRFSLISPSPVKIEILDIKGTIVHTQIAYATVPGSHDLAVTPNGLTPGIYLLRLTVGNEMTTRKLIIAN